MPAPSTAQVVMELRVHGVRGTPTASMLGVDQSRVVQVAGDRLTGFYRIADGADPPLRTLPPGMALEAYSWGELTSGVRGMWGWVTRVLWLGLLPFALVNLAFWARTQVGENNGQARWGLRAVRVSGLILTAIAVLTACFIAIDLIAWQCFRANSVACPVLPGWMDGLASLTAGRRIAVTSLVPVAMVLGLVALTRQSVTRYEATPDAPAQATRDQEHDRCADNVLGHPRMWQGEHRTRQLLYLHVALALATIVLFSGVHLIAREATGPVWATTLAAAAVALLVVARALSVDEDDPEFRDTWKVSVAGTTHEFPRRPMHWMTGPGELLRRMPLRPVALAAAVVVAAHLALLWTTDVTREDGDWYGANLWFIGLFVALTIVHVIVFVGGRARLRGTFLVVLLLLALVVGGRELPTLVLAGLTALVWLALMIWHHRQAAKPEQAAFAWGGAGASVMLGGATMVALLFTSAAAVAAADYLNDGSQSVADLTTRRNENAPLSAAGETDPLTLAGDVVLEGARIVRTNTTVAVTHGTVRTDALTRRSRVDPDSSYSMASSRVQHATLALPEGVTTVRLVSACFGTNSAKRSAVCTGESTGFRTAGVLIVRPTCEVDGTVRRCLTVDAAGGRVALEVTDPPQTPLVVPQILVWTPLMQLAVIVSGAVVTGLLVWRFRRRAAPLIRARVDDDDPVVPEQDRAAVKNARVTAALAHRGERLLDGIGAVASLLAVITLALSSAGRPPWDWWEPARPLATLSLYVALGLSVALMMLGARIRRSPTARRNVGVLWDITTFWPRAAHPFAPPCYAERVVPEITTRVRWAMGEEGQDPGRVVVLSGHSQGSLICVAVASRLNGRATQLRLLTYGSQIRALYGRVFPAAAGPDALGYVPTTGPALMGEAWPDVPNTPPDDSPAMAVGLRERLQDPAHWVNLFRRSDPLGYRVYSDRDHVVLDRPTLEVRRAGSGDPGSMVMTHGGYQHTPEYREAIAEWTGETVQVPSTDPASTEPLPPA
ncbi:hypothetical protein GL325_05325 [Aeromicrobium sp. 636]|uniref:Integral membrane protein n=1 Tax=Aeromicrobium senzhongii TaxID=2663859 RepID=A0A8I0EV86_9ACTN|nr:MULTISPECIES: hypothetical protein [Aeromicrobium]MBC9225737.1 hypothetical protein [Aeromicrobium senzhongii]MCQ3997846.1 hypothetical protein [Aeromicrobium sp. 636]